MAIAAKAIGACQGYISCRPEYALAVKRLHLAIHQARLYGLLGKDILGSGFNFDIEVYAGDRTTLRGEETTLTSAIEEGRGIGGIESSRVSFPADWGLRKKSTLLNQVETYANLPRIIQLGGEAYTEVGKESSKGQKLFS